MARAALAMAGVFAVLAGCDSGPNLIDVQGTIKVAGKPIDKIHVEFWPEGNGPRSIGITDAQGKFTLTSDDGTQKGALLGTHKVVLRDVGILSDKFIGRAAEDLDLTEGRKPRIADLYGDPLKSPLKVEVTADKKPIELEAQPYGAGGPGRAAER
jgi:hypothetical protein